MSEEGREEVGSVVERSKCEVADSGGDGLLHGGCVAASKGIPSEARLLWKG